MSKIAMKSLKKCVKKVYIFENLWYSICILFKPKGFLIFKFIKFFLGVLEKSRFKFSHKIDLYKMNGKILDKNIDIVRNKFKQNQTKNEITQKKIVLRIVLLSKK